MYLCHQEAKMKLRLLSMLIAFSVITFSQRQSDNSNIRPEKIIRKNGLPGWKIQIPGNRPLATPAYADGKLYVGGGYGSYEFYCIDAASGRIDWVFKTGDDGPTAAIVKKGYVVFNTESCIIYVLKAKTGEKVWEKWLGDPLMSQPACDDQNVYMAYPGNDGMHHLACLRLSDGKNIWDVKINGDLISAPIIDQGSVYIVCFDGTVYRYAAADGRLIWSQPKNATCAPVIYQNRIFLSIRQAEKDASDTTRQYEGLASLTAAKGDQEQKDLWARRLAPYLVYGRSTANTKLQAELDASVGFSAAPGTAKIDQARENVGQATVAGCWAYQGSRPVIANGISYNAMGEEIQALDITTGKKVWTNIIKVTEEGIGGRYLAPPSAVNNKLFIGSGQGDVLCLNAQSGKILWQEKVAGSVSFQPAVAQGMVFVPCDNGLLYGFSTGDAGDDGWYMWGGNAEHNR